jgi:hypothetical protein
MNTVDALIVGVVPKIRSRGLYVLHELAIWNDRGYGHW